MGCHGARPDERRGRLRPVGSRHRRRSQGRAGEVQGHQGRGQRRLHSGAGQGRSQHLRHRPGDDRRQGLHRGRRHLRGLDPVDLQGLHHGQGDRGAGAGGDPGQHGRRRHRPGVQLDQRGRAVQGLRDERHGQPRRHHRDQHGVGQQPRRDLEQDPLAGTATLPGARSRSTRRSTSPRPRPTSATRGSRS